MSRPGASPDSQEPFIDSEDAAPRPRRWIRGVAITMALTFALIAVCGALTG